MVSLSIVRHLDSRFRGMTEVWQPHAAHASFLRLVRQSSHLGLDWPTQADMSLRRTATVFTIVKQQYCLRRLRRQDRGTVAVRDDLQSRNRSAGTARLNR
jgi:hypothetical protein